MRPPSVALSLLALAAFLAPICGGHVPLDRSSLESGLMPAVMAAIWTFDAPSLAHTVLGLLVVGSLLTTFLTNRVIQIPQGRLAGPLLGFLALLAFSTVLSNFKAVSLASLAEWLAYGCAYFAVVAAAGRDAGPRLILFAVFAGCAVTALRGLNEYAGAPPDFRIFGGWQNPNALAGILVIGLLIGCGLALSSEGLAAFASGAGITVISVALALSQSKGGYLAAMAGLLALALILLSYRKKLVVGLVAIIALDVGLYVAGPPGTALWLALLATVVAGLWFLYLVVGKRVVNVAAPLAMAIALIVIIALRPLPGAPEGAAPTTFSRVSAPASTGDQSVRYRLNLWRSSFALIKMNPAGFGLNTFQFHGARPGVVGAGTVYAHQSFLQLAIEAGPLAALFLLAFLVLVFREGVRGLSKTPTDAVGLKAGVIAALIGASAHCLTESNLYIMGYGLVFFMLAGVAVQLAYDGSAPELVPKEARWVLGTVAGVVALMLAYFGWVGTLKARINGDLVAGDLEGATRGSEQLLGLAPNDGEAHYIASGAAAPAGQQFPGMSRGTIERLKKAADLRPSPKYLRALARHLHASGKSAQALSTLDRALYWDPNNWDALHQKLEIEMAAKDTEAAIFTARRLIASEATPAFQIRALPEFPPLETYMARVFLASLEQDKAKKAALLQEAVDGYYKFAWFTVSNVNSGLLSPQSGAYRATEGRALAADLAGLYRELGQTNGAERAAYLEEEFRKLAELLAK